MRTFRTWRVTPAFAVTIGVAAAVGVGAHPAAAQLSPYGDQQNVLVDLNAVGSGGSAYFSGFGGTDGQLLAPPSRSPKSQLLVARPPVSDVTPEPAPQSQVMLTPPKPAAVPRQKPAAAVMKSEPTMPKVAPKPREKVEARPAPKPAAAPPPPAPEVAKAVPPKPALPAEKPAPLAARETPPPAPEMPKAAAQPPPMPAVASPKPETKPKPELPKPAAVSEQASRTPAAETPSDVVSVAFPAEEAELPQGAGAKLNDVTTRLAKDSELRLQLMAYAGGPSLSSSKARRLSLSRALAVRSYLIDKGIRSSRIDVRALGDKIPEGEPNRVDIRYTRR